MATCVVCGLPMPPGEEVFNYHGYSGPCPGPPIEKREDALRRKIAEALNSVSAENGSDTPDFILAEYLHDCLMAFDKATTRRAEWYCAREVTGERP